VNVVVFATQNVGQATMQGPRDRDAVPSQPTRLCLTAGRRLPGTRSTTTLLHLPNFGTPPATSLPGNTGGSDLYRPNCSGRRPATVATLVGESRITADPRAGNGGVGLSRMPARSYQSQTLQAGLEFLARGRAEGLLECRARRAPIARRMVGGV